MKQWAKQSGFTIVELTIVIVVIAILAAISIVGYVGVKENAVASKIQAELTQTKDQISLYAAKHGGSYPDNLTDIELTNSDVVYDYASDNTVSPKFYALTAWDTTAGNIQYYVSSTQNAVTKGIAPGNNLIPWNEPDADTQPVSGSGTAIVTNTYYSSPASMRLAPGNTNRFLRLSPFTAEVGQVLTITFRMKTDSNWDGTNSMSKVRFSRDTDGGLLGACSYNGVKTSWTEFTCNYTFTLEGVPVRAALGNDGSVGNIWFDDIYVSIK